MSLLKKKKKMGSGGMVDSKIYGRGDESKQSGVHLTNYVGKGNSTAGSFAKSAVRGNTSLPKEKLNEFAKEEHHRVLGEMRSDKTDRKNLAEGGMADCPNCCDGAMCDDHMVSSMMAKRKMAEGGDTGQGWDKFISRQKNKPVLKGVHTAVMKGDPGTSIAGSNVAGHGYGNNMESAKRQHKEKLEELRSMPAPKGNYAHGGEVEEESLADFDPNEFDELELNPPPMDNSSAGNEHGDGSLLEDMVSKVMLKRRKQSNPRPA